MKESYFNDTMKNAVYLDSTVFSFYYDNRPGSLYRQRITIDWWDTQRQYYDNYTSFFVKKEVSIPTYPNWEKVTALADLVPVLEETPEIRGIVKV